MSIEWNIILYNILTEWNTITQSLKESWEVQSDYFCHSGNQDKKD